MSSNWNTLAELDPLWTILSDPEKKFGKWDPQDFFSTGAQEAERVLSMCKANSINVSYGRFLDFGCGVGRMTRGFAAYFSSCVGIDVSEKMVSLAKEFDTQMPRCEFMTSDSQVLPFADKTFDFVFTVLVLQHLPKKSTILNYIAEFIRVARPNGVVVFQLPNEVPLRRRLQIRRRLWWLLSSIGIPRSWLFKELGLAPIKMNGIAKSEVEKFIRSRGATVQAVERYDAAEGQHHSYYYFVVV
jgi:SAM-dependent methyltransferase